MLTENKLPGYAQQGHRFKVDGHRKLILDARLTGSQLYAIAGDPQRLEVVGGGTVPNNDDDYQLPKGDDTEFVTKFEIGAVPVFNPEHELPVKEKVDPAHSQTKTVQAEPPKK
jgi:hypothetical protein